VIAAFRDRSSGEWRYMARKTLDLFERTLNVFEDHLRRLTEGE
jgi:hypothetical protein